MSYQYCVKFFTYTYIIALVIVFFILEYIIDFLMKYPSTIYSCNTGIVILIIMFSLRKFTKVTNRVLHQEELVLLKKELIKRYLLIIVPILILLNILSNEFNIFSIFIQLLGFIGTIWFIVSYFLPDFGQKIQKEYFNKLNKISE